MHSIRILCTIREEFQKVKEKEEQRLLKLKEIDQDFFNMGMKYVCGIDEAGRGPLAGPVVVASVMLPENSMIEGVNDSKKISESKREKLYDVILSEAISYGIGIIYQDEIDEINILQATKKGLHEAVANMEIKPNVILVDALTGIDTLGIPYKSIIKGDAKSYSIGAASIIAKVTRDRIMREWDKVYPEYGFAGHKGYGTAKHIEAIKKYGLTPIHRRSFCKKLT
ncbi:MAG: ribonuclease HII [Clostridia bacterium]|nr:ribonuclease HII [Clostridia bacterium]